MNLPACKNILIIQLKHAKFIMCEIHANLMGWNPATYPLFLFVGLNYIQIYTNISFRFGSLLRTSSYTER